MIYYQKKKVEYMIFYFFIGFIFIFLIINVLKYKKKYSDLQNSIQKDITKKTDNEMSELKVNYPLGTKIIVLSNEPYSKENFNKLIIAEVVGYEELTKAKKPVLLYTEIGDNKVLFCNGIIAYHNNRLEKLLNSHSWYDRYNLLSYGKIEIDEEFAKERERALLNK